jgi:hypothetical protein
MNAPVAAFIGMALAWPSCALDQKIPPKRVYVDRMYGMEPVVEEALRTMELPFEFVEEERQPEWKATLDRMHSFYGEILIRQKMGRNETHRLELRDIERRKVVAWHAFELKMDAKSQERAAREFARKVRAALLKQNRK